MNCSICFEDITKQTGSTTLSCDHTFHFRCISNWFIKQMLDDLAQSCPCCRSEGCPLDRAVFDDEDVEENQTEEADSDYEEEDTEDIESLNDLAREIQQGLFRLERLPSGEWVIQNNEELAFDSFRSLFHPLNQLDQVDESPVPQRFSIYHWTIQDGTITRPASNREVQFIENQTILRPATANQDMRQQEAARKIQAFFRRNQLRNTHAAAMTLMRLFQQAYNL